MSGTHFSFQSPESLELSELVWQKRLGWADQPLLLAAQEVRAVQVVVEVGLLTVQLQHQEVVRQIVASLVAHAELEVVEVVEKLVGLLSTVNDACIAHVSKL